MHERGGCSCAGRLCTMQSFWPKEELACPKAFLFSRCIHWLNKKKPSTQTVLSIPWIRLLCPKGLDVDLKNLENLLILGRLKKIYRPRRDHSLLARRQPKFRNTIKGQKLGLSRCSYWQLLDSTLSHYYLCISWSHNNIKVTLTKHTPLCSLTALHKH